jgi:hypothetical protein
LGLSRIKKLKNPIFSNKSPYIISLHNKNSEFRSVNVDKKKHKIRADFSFKIGKLGKIGRFRIQIAEYRN